MNGEKLDRLFHSANCVEIVFYIAEHPGCMKSEIYKFVSRNAHTSDKIQAMADEGIIEIIKTDGSKTTYLDLTDKGRALHDLLMRAEAILHGSEDDDIPSEDGPEE